ncbi:MAG: NUDIX hydrolase [Candidatus Solibacter usitatus]|nr:NUDIX hydrolase [Candidatus Solibacter usitatus]
MKTRADLLAALERHTPHDSHEAGMLERISAFVAGHEDCCERLLLIGHVTGSAWVVNPQRTCALMVHHARLGKWLQPGGHADGSFDILAVAMREVEEETGIRAAPVSAAIFDVDAHDIPARKTEPAHVHYDIRYLLEAGMDEQPVVSPESRDVAWVALDDVETLNTDASVLRLVEKTKGRP